MFAKVISRLKRFYILDFSRNWPFLHSSKLSKHNLLYKQGTY